MDNTAIRDRALEIGHICIYEYWVVPNPMMQRELDGEEPYWKEAGLDPLWADYTGLNGYVVLPKRVLREPGYHGIASYIPVHGGITYAEEDDIGMVYGFDTAHHDSKKFPHKKPAWIKHQCAVLLNGLIAAAEVERNYLRCTTNKGKAKHIERVLDVEPTDEGNLGMNINLLLGRL